MGIIKSIQGNIPIFSTSGGLGDLLIQCNKILHLGLGEPIHIYSYEKHECLERPMKELLKLFGLIGTVSIRQDAYKEAIKKVARVETYPAIDQFNKDGGYVSSQLFNYKKPFIKKILGDSPTENSPRSVVVSLEAGRNNDRFVSPNIACQLAKLLPYPVVIIGMEKVYHPGPIVNCTGELSLQTVFSLINSCSLFVGQDGIFSYYAAMCKKPTIINYHEPNLINHYFSPLWADHVLTIIDSGRFIYELPKNQKLHEFLYRLSKN